MPRPVVPASPSMNTLGLFDAMFLLLKRKHEKPRRRCAGGVWLDRRTGLDQRDLVPLHRPARLASHARTPPLIRHRRRSWRMALGCMGRRLGAAAVPVNGVSRIFLDPKPASRRKPGPTPEPARSGQVGPGFRRDARRRDSGLSYPPAFAPNSKASASRTVSRSSRCASIKGAVSSMISSMSRTCFRRL